MDNLKILICDDEPEVVELTERLCRQYGEEYNKALEIKGVTAFEDAEGFTADLVFLDMEMPGRSGLDIKEELEETQPKTLVIFVTSHDETVFDAFGRNVIGFFEKPMDYERMCELMDKNFSLRSIYEKVELEDGVVTVSDILYITVKDVYSQVFLTDGKAPFVRRGLAAWESILPEGGFLRISDKCLINCQYVDKIQGNRLRLENCDTAFAFSSRRKKGCIDRYRNYCRKMSRYGR